MEEHTISISNYSNTQDMDIGEIVGICDESQILTMVVAEIEKSLESNDMRDIIVSVRRKNERRHKP